METLTVTCPDCNTVLIVDKKTGKVVETRKPLVKESSGDRFEDARRRVLESQQRAEEKFKAVSEKRKTKIAELDKYFREKTEEMKDQPVEKPEGIYDKD